MIYDTHTMTLHQDDCSFPNGSEFNWTEEHVTYAVNHAVSKSDLEVSLPMEFRNFGISEIVKGTVYSKVAYVESNAGYFIISEDMMFHINVTYSRWD